MGRVEISELVLHSAVNRRAGFAGGDVRAVDAGDGVVRERLKVLRLQRGRVIGLVVERRAEGEEGRATGRATIRGRVGGRARTALLEDRVRAGGGCGLREAGEEA